MKPRSRREGFDALFPNEVDGVVRGDLEQPRRKGESRSVLIQTFEGLGEGFNGQIFCVILAEHHAVDQVKDGPFVALHQLSVSLLILLLCGAQHECVVVLGFFGEVGVHFHGVESEIWPRPQDQTRKTLVTGSNRSSQASLAGWSLRRKNNPKVSERTINANERHAADVTEGL